MSTHRSRSDSCCDLASINLAVGRVEIVEVCCLLFRRLFVFLRPSNVAVAASAATDEEEGANDRRREAFHARALALDFIVYSSSSATTSSFDVSFIELYLSHYAIQCVIFDS